MNRANPFIGINIVQKWPRSSSLLTTGSYQRLYLCWHRSINKIKCQRYQYCNYWYIDILDMKRKNAVLSNFKWTTVSFKKYKLKPIKNIIITAKNAWSVLMQEWCVVNVYFLYTFFQRSLTLPLPSTITFVFISVHMLTVMLYYALLKVMMMKKSCSNLWF